MSTLVSDMVREYGELTRAAVRHYLSAREPRRYLYDLVADYPERGGKMMRPSLCIATARAFGTRLEDGLLTAASLVPKNDQAVEQLERDRSRHQKVKRNNASRVIAQKCLPTLGGWPLALGHIPRHG